MKLTEAFGQFDGTGDFAQYVDRFETIAHMQNISNLASMLPVVLTGGAYAVYKGLSDEVRADYGRAKQALMAAFLPHCFGAYAALSGRRLQPGESMDVFAAELLRLISLVLPGGTGAAVFIEAWQKCAFVEGLPEALKTQLKAACDLPSMTMTEIVVRARQLVVSTDVCMVSATKPIRRSDEEARPPTTKSVICHRCRGVGHIATNCAQRASPRYRSVVCYCCGQAGHVSSVCRHAATNLNQPKNE